jgi:outer membrane lipoprotein-sorting protein
VLGNFLMTNDAIFKQGLMCGVLSSGWPLLDAERRQATVDFVGTKSIDGRVLHELRYLPRGNSDLKITLYFDATDFRHVRTEYERVIPAPMGRVEYSNVQEREGRYKMIEDFSLFKAEGELTLPHIYTIKLSVDTVNGTFLADWTIKLTNFEFNQKIDPAAFNVSAP